MPKNIEVYFKRYFLNKVDKSAKKTEIGVCMNDSIDFFSDYANYSHFLYVHKNANFRYCS